MTLTELPCVLYPILIVPGLLGSLIVLRIALRGDCVGTIPFCRRCGYNLTGLTSGRCPECGQEITPDRVVHGTRQRRPVLIVGAALSLLFFAMVASFAYLDWYRHKPAVWLMSNPKSPASNGAQEALNKEPAARLMNDLDSGDSNVVQKAFDELKRRERAGELPAEWQSRLIDYCLTQQVTYPSKVNYHDIRNYLGSLYARGLLSGNQRSRMFQQIVRYKLLTRSRIVVGDKLPFRIDCWESSPALAITLKVDQIEARIDDQQPVSLGESPSELFVSHGTSSLETKRLDTKLWPVGRHAFGIKARAAFFIGPYGRPPPDEPTSPPVHEHRITLTAPVEVLAKEPPGGLVPGVRDDAFKDTLVEFLQLARIGIEKGSLQGAVYVDSQITRRNPRSIPVAFDIIARIGGREVPLNTTFTSALNHNYNEDAWFSSKTKVGLPAPSATFDIILRGSSKAARDTIDLNEYWDGELVFRNVVSGTYQFFDAAAPGKPKPKPIRVYAPD